MARGIVLPAEFHLQRLEAVDSTNAEAKRRAAQGAPDGTVIQAGAQTAGRGRQGRVWESPPGNLYCSLLLRPDCAPGMAVQAGFLTALAAGEAVARHLPPEVAVRCKWPNDLLVDGAKVAGILLETGIDKTGRVDWLVIGLGINIASHPPAASYPTTSLIAAGADRVSPDDLLAAYCASFAVWRHRWREFGFEPVRRAWLAKASGIGKGIRVRLENEELTGVFADLDPGGALILETAAGERRRISAGDVFPAAA